MLLQALFLVAFWTGIGILHKQSLAYAAAVKRLEAAKQVEGKWQTVDRDGLALEMREGKFRFSRNGSLIIRGNYSLAKRALAFLPETSSSHTNAWILRDEEPGAELVLWSEDDFQMTALMKILERELADRVEDEEKVWRFTRVKE
jgi:hypothetical protein